MKFRLTACITGILFLGVVASTHFAPSHYPKSRHMDSGLLSQQELYSRKVKKYIQDLVEVIHPQPSCYSSVIYSCTTFTEFFVAGTSTLIVSWRAPPV